MKVRFLFTLACSSLVIACSGSGSDGGGGSSSAAPADDNSASGAAASAVGGGVGSSSANGASARLTPIEPRSPLLLPFSSVRAFAAGNPCPSLKSTNGSGSNSCSSTSNVATLTYAACSYGGSAATWNGIESISFSGSTTLSCGAFPAPTSDVFRRQFVASAGGAAGSGSRTNARGTTVTIDDSTSGIQGNYQADTFNGSGASGYTGTYFNTGSGKLITFTSGKRSSIAILEHLSAQTAGGANPWDHTVAGTVNLSETGSGSSTVWTASSGTVTSGHCANGLTVYHNKAKVMGQSCFQNVTYSTSCCTPTSGSITTTFASTSASTGAASLAMNGKTETLTIQSCGVASYTDYTGASSTVSLGNCF